MHEIIQNNWFQLSFFQIIKYCYLVDRVNTLNYLLSSLQFSNIKEDHGLAMLIHRDLQFSLETQSSWKICHQIELLSQTKLMSSSSPDIASS